MRLAEIVDAAILDAMKRHSGHKPAVAEELGIALKTLCNKLERINNKQPATSAGERG